MKKQKNNYAPVLQISSDELSSTNWTEISGTFHGSSLDHTAAFGEDQEANYAVHGKGSKGDKRRFKAEGIATAGFRPQELFVSIGRGNYSTNTLDHNTWLDYIEISTNDTLANICEGYGCTETSPMISVNHISNPRNMESVGMIMDDLIVEIINYYLLSIKYKVECERNKRKKFSFTIHNKIN